MSITLDSDATAAVTSTARGAHYLIELYFATGLVSYTTHAVDITASVEDIDTGASVARTFTGFGNLVDVSALGESENSADEKISLGLSLVNTALLAACVGNVANYRGRRVRIYLQFIGPTFQPAGAPELIWQGRMEPVSIDPKQAEGGGITGRISLPCRRAGMAMSRRSEGMRLSDAQHQATYPGDKGYEFLQTLHERPTPIVTKRFQEFEA